MKPDLVRSALVHKVNVDVIAGTECALAGEHHSLRNSLRSLHSSSPQVIFGRKIVSSQRTQVGLEVQPLAEAA